MRCYFDGQNIISPMHLFSYRFSHLMLSVHTCIDSVSILNWYGRCARKSCKGQLDRPHGGIAGSAPAGATSSQVTLSTSLCTSYDNAQSARIPRTRISCRVSYCHYSRSVSRNDGSNCTFLVNLVCHSWKAWKRVSSMLIRTLDVRQTNP